MRSITKTVLEQHVQEYTTYECDIPRCDFTTDNKLLADIHYGGKHCLKKLKEVDHTNFLFFDSENDAMEYWKWYRAHWRIDGGQDISQFSGNGWYYIIEDTVIGRYQCEIYQIGMRPIANELERLLNEQLELRLRYEKIERLLHEN